MDKIAVVTGADRGLGLAIVNNLLDMGWTVLAGRYLSDYSLLSELSQNYPGKLHTLDMDVSSTQSVQNAAKAAAAIADHIDVVICNAAFMGHPPDEVSEAFYAGIARSFNTNSLGNLRTVESFLPLMSTGMKRLCFVSSEVSSVAMTNTNMAKNRSSYGYCMSKTAINMGVRLLYNDLYNKGFTFRIYQPGWMMHENTDGTYDKNADFEPTKSAAAAVPQFIEPRDDEDRLVMIDYMGNEWSF